MFKPEINKKLFNRIYILIIIFALIIVFTHYFQNNYHQPSLGADETIKIWPYNNFIFSENLISSLSNLGGNLGFEDHIFFSLNIFSSIIPFDKSDVLLFIKKTNLLFFCLSLIMIFKICEYLFNNRTVSIFFCFFILCNKSITYEHVSYFYSYTLVLFFQLINFFYLIKVLKKFKYKNILIFFVFNFLGTFVYENFFTYFVFEFFFCLSYFFFHPTFKVTKIIFFIYLKSLISFLSYITLHYLKYGSFLVGYGRPYNSLDEFVSTTLTVAQNLFDDILFGIPSFFYNNKIIFIFLIVLAAVIIFMKIDFKKLSENFYLILIASTPTTLAIFYTGRYDAGMWSFYTILISLIIFQTLFALKYSNKKYFNFIFSFILISIFIFNPLSKRLLIQSEMKNLKAKFDESIFRLIEKDNFYSIKLNVVTENPTLRQRIIDLTRLPTGVDIFHGGNGLYFYENEKSYWPKNFEIFYTNNSNKIKKSEKFDIRHILQKKNNAKKNEFFIFDNFVTKRNDYENFDIEFFISPLNYYLIKNEIEIYKDLDKIIDVYHGNNLDIQKLINFFEIDQISEISIIIDNKLNISDVKLEIDDVNYFSKISTNGLIKINIPINAKKLILLSDNTNITNHIKKINFKTLKTIKKKKEKLQSYGNYEFISNKSACRLKLELNYGESEIFKYKTIIKSGEKVNLVLYDIKNLDPGNSKLRLLKLENNYKENSKVKFYNIKPNNNQKILC